MSKFQLKLVTPEGVVFDHEATKVTLPTPEGHITVLANHKPIITLLSPGEIILHEDRDKKYLATEGGVAHIGHNLVKVLADTAESADELDELVLEEAKEKAKKRMADAEDEKDYAAAEAALEKQIAKLQVLKRRKKYRE